MQPIAEIWSLLASKYSSSQVLIDQLWDEIERNYSAASRHYHDLSHLENMLSHAFNHESRIEDFDTLLFSIFYHDLIYNAKKKDNEEKSAKVSTIRLTELGVPNEMIKRCHHQILATKSHQSTYNDSDTDFLLDIDLSILGDSWEKYEQYFRGVRQEYKMYPDLLYKPGRRNVIQHFLDMEHIYKTESFKTKFEKKAKQNLSKEFELLS